MLLLTTKDMDLLIEDDLPSPLQLLCAHVAAFKAVFERLGENDFYEHTLLVNCPAVSQRLGHPYYPRFEPIRCCARLPAV
jgi:hypothetical protein